MTEHEIETFLESAREIALEAGEAILEIYERGDFQVKLKGDETPFTLADKKSHELIVGELKKRFPHIPIISEESRTVPYEKRREWEVFWLIDPLDGTKEFLKRNGEFTVNIALIERGVPVAGVVYAPALGVLYWGGVGIGSWKEQGNKKIHLLEKIKNPDNFEQLVAVGSRSHAHPKEEDVFNSLGVMNVKRIGSSLKFCLVAEGEADIYYRASPVWEWDTGAGDAIVRAVGGQTLSQGHLLKYNKPDMLHSNGFVCIRNPKILQKFPFLKEL